MCVCVCARTVRLLCSVQHACIQYHVCVLVYADVFLQRIGRLKQYLLQRPELVIGMVAHWEVINALTGGADLENCELRTYTLTHEGHVRERHRYATVRHAA